MTHTLRHWLTAEPFTLTCSSGFFSFFAHTGMFSVLEDEDLLPCKVTGSSAGALVTAAWTSGLSIHRLKHHLFRLTRQDFWDPAPGLGLLKGEKFRQLITAMTPINRLEHGRVPIALSVYDYYARQTIVVREGPLTDWVYASCAFPLLLQPLRHNGRLYGDGGIRDRPGLAGTQPSERVFYHHITSKSPWRTANSPTLQLPQRPNLLTLALDNLPRSGPTKLHLGPLIYTRAREATQRALDHPLTDNHLRIST